MYGLNNRDENTEMRARYSAMVNVLSDILNCGIWDVEALFDSENNIEVGEIVKNWVEETGTLPNWNTVHYEALADFASDHDLEMGVDVDIYTNSCLDTHIYAKEGLDADIVAEMENLFGMDANVLSR